MNLSITVTAAASALMLAACGGGGTSDAPAPLIPVNDQGSTIFTPEPGLPAVDNTDAGIGALSELLGQASFAYGFTGTEAVFLVDVTFTPNSVVVVDSGNSVLTGRGSASARLTTNGSFVDDGNVDVGCAFAAEVSRFTCVVGSGGESRILFAFGRLENNSVIGSFEYCEQAVIEICVADLLQAPDGIVALVVSNTLAKRSAATGQASLSGGDGIRPYLQYLEQGTLSVDSGAAAQKASDYTDAITATVERIESLSIN